MMFYLNITCGLMLISQEKYILKCLGLSVVIFPVISAIFNALGRIGFSAAGDKCKDRNTIYKVIFGLSIICTAAVILTKGIVNGSGNMILTALVVVLIMVVNAGYGGGFSNVATLLSDHYGMGSISAIHGITLSAWAFAGLTGNQMAAWIVKTFGEEITTAEGLTVNPTGYQYVLYATLALYVVALLVSMFLVKPSEAGEAVDVH
jgi:OFA family oxalate/formate antiporter-like MFS transporter